MDADRKEWVQSWRLLHPQHVHKIWTDADALTFVRSTFDARIVDAYQRLPLVVQRTDLLRHLLLWQHGGTYADIDVRCLRPMSTWKVAANATMIVGLEWDRDMHENDTQICQWTMAAQPRHPVVRDVIQMVVDAVHRASNETLHDRDQVVPLTGPLPWTRVIMQYLSNHACSITHMRVGANECYGVVVLGITSFSPRHARGYGVHHPWSYVEHLGTGDRPDGWKHTVTF